ncbi:MAG: hypothetical protein RI953_292 [Pseudomonadota bacterium]|jgi:hypothetical protein
MSQARTYFLRTFQIAALSFSHFIWASPALAQGSFKMTTPFFDSEHADGFVLSPKGEMAFVPSSQSNWSAATQISIIPLQSNNPSKGFELRLKEAQIEHNFEAFKTRLGRILLRSESSGLNESSKAFLRSEPSMDGIGLESKFGGTHAELFIGGPRVIGFEVHQNFTSLRAALLYRAEREKLLQIDLPGPDATFTTVQRAAVVQEAEIALRATSESYQAEALFQLLQQADQHLVTIEDQIRGRYKIGAVDNELPSSVSDYRTAVQIKTQLFKDADSTEWMIASFAAKNTVRYFNPIDEAHSAMKGASGHSQYSLGIETSGNSFSAQAGVSAEYSSSKKFQWFGRSLSDGSPLLVKSRWTGWFSTKFKF